MHLDLHLDPYGSGNSPIFFLYPSFWKSLFVSKKTHEQFEPIPTEEQSLEEGNDDRSVSTDDIETTSLV